jgi:hypothetical protein
VLTLNFRRLEIRALDTIAHEGGSAWEAVKKLVAHGNIDCGERVVVFDTGTRYKYVE